MSCVGCALFSSWDTLFTGYSTTIASQLAPYAKRMLNAALTFYWVFRIASHIGGKEVDLGDLGKEIFMTTAAAAVLNMPSIWFDFINTLLDLGIKLAQFMTQATPSNGTSFGTGLGGLLEAVEYPMNILMRGVKSIVSQASLFDIVTQLAAGALVVVFGLLWFLIVKDAVWFYTRFLFVKSIGPLILVCLAVPATRGTASQAWRILVSGVFEFVALGMIVGLTTTTLENTLAFSPLGKPGLPPARSFLFSQSYFELIFTGGLLLFLRTTFNHLAARMADAVSDSAGGGAKQISMSILKTLTNLGKSGGK